MKLYGPPVNTRQLVFTLDEIDRAVRWLEVQARLTFADEVLEETDKRIITVRYTPWVCCIIPPLVISFAYHT
jgi:hypothetical protein